MKKWFIAVKQRGDDIFDLTGDLEILEGRGDKSYADPFIFRDYLFFEEFDQKKGVISCVKVTSGKFAGKNKIHFSQPVVVLERPYHLSYPYILEDEGNIYMIPESLGNNTIEIYRADPFPYKWMLESTIMRGVAPADPNIIKHNGMYYLFCTFHGDNNLEIHKSEDLHKGWELCTRKQIENSRSAGSIFEYDGGLVRPVQICTKEEYGKGIIFRKISVDPYSEIEIHRINPDWMDGLLGTHTFNFNEEYVVIDGKYEA